MTNDEAKEAFISGVPVVHKDEYRHIDQRYTRISAIIYRYIKGKLCVSAELADGCGNSVTIASVDSIFVAE